MVFPKELVSSWCDRRADKYNIKKMFCITEGILAICFVKSGVNIYVYTCNSYERPTKTRCFKSQRNK